MGSVLFVSQTPLGRCENLTAVWEAYDGDKAFRQGQDSMRTAERDGFSVVVCDALPAYIEGKSSVKVVNICHGITGNKFYGLDEGDEPWIDRDAFAQTDYAITASVDSIPIVAGQLGIPTERVLPLGIPRTDAYVGARKGDGGTFMANNPRAYLYVPTFRDYVDGGWIPHIDWQKVDRLLGEDEVIVVKRHYFTEKPIVDAACMNVVEILPDLPTGPYIIDCDVVLTDYSSVEFDGYLCGKPSVLTTDDADVFLANRGMYHQYPDFYSSRWLNVERNEEALVMSLRLAAQFGMTKVERDCIRTLAGACDGHSTERVCELIGRLA